MERITNKVARRIVAAAISDVSRNTRIHRDVLRQEIPAAYAAIVAASRRGSISRREAERVACEAIAARWQSIRPLRSHGVVMRSSWDMGVDTVIGTLGYGAV